MALVCAWMEFIAVSVPVCGCQCRAFGVTTGDQSGSHRSVLTVCLAVCLAGWAIFAGTASPHLATHRQEGLTSQLLQPHAQSQCHSLRHTESLPERSHTGTLSIPQPLLLSLHGLRSQTRFSFFLCVFSAVFICLIFPRLQLSSR